MKYLKILFFTTTLCVLASDFSFAQKDNPTQKPKYTVYSKNKYKQNPKHTWSWFSRKRYYSVGLGINAMNYFGDITPQPSFTSLDIKFTRINFSAYVQRRLYPGVTGRLAFSYGRIKGEDASVTPDRPRWEHNQFRYIRNLSFRSDLYELSAIGVFDFTKNRGVFYQRPKRVIPYITAGVAVFYHNPEAVAPSEDQLGNPLAEAGEWVKLQPLGTEGQGYDSYTKNYRLTADTLSVTYAGGRRYSKVQIAFPLGFGLRYKLSSRWDIAFEVSYRFTLTDYLDDVSKSYVDLGVFGDNNLARAMSDRSREGGRAGAVRSILTGDFLGDYTYTGIDGRRYTTFTGFGNDQYIDNIRGNVTDRDVYIVTGFHVSYIMPGQVRCPEPFKRIFRRHRL
ncbi:MAG: hypothetical protein MUE81_01700 [Thermoflexibacter sp.]|nr:hypothetical protein [Thermoflexibacter sp.]